MATLYEAMVRNLGSIPRVQIVETKVSSQHIDDVVSFLQSIPGIEGVRADSTRGIRVEERDRYGNEISTTYRNVGVITIDIDRRRLQRGQSALGYLKGSLADIHPFICVDKGDSHYLGYRMRLPHQYDFAEPSEGTEAVIIRIRPRQKGVLAQRVNDLSKRIRGYVR